LRSYWQQVVGQKATAEGLKSNCPRTERCGCCCWADNVNFVEFGSTEYPPFSNLQSLNDSVFDCF